LAQLFVINVIRHRSRTRVLAVVSVLWSVFWIVLDLVLGLPKFSAIVAICSAMVVFAVGETLLSPVGPAIINDIAPEHLRGRYNAAQGLTWGISGSLAPAMIALYFDNGIGNWWPVSVGVLALTGGALMLNLRRHLTPMQDGRVAHDEPEAPRGHDPVQ
jgi:MFS family permease